MERKILQRLFEIVVGRRLETISTTSKKVLIAVHRQNLFLGVDAFDLESEHRLLDLPNVGLFTIEEERAG